VVDPTTLLRLLDTLKRSTLIRLLGEFHLLKPKGYLSRALLLEALQAAPQVSTEEVLDSLSRAELIPVCKRLGAHPSGSRHQLVQRLRRLLRWLPFTEARTFVRALGLQSEKEWRTWSKGARPDLPPRPASIPASPSNTYRDGGWAGVGDWLGTGTIATHLRIYWPYERAKRYVQELELRNKDEWTLWSKGKLRGRSARPPEIPRTPTRVYADHWVSWGDWLGTGNVNNKDRIFLPYAEARRHTRQHAFSTASAWLEWRFGHRPDLPACPSGMPSHPGERYRGQGWKGWRDFVGPTYTGPSRSFRSFAASRKFVRALGITSLLQYQAWSRGDLPELLKRPHDVPTNPQLYYRDQWQGWGHFLGTGRLHAGGPPKRSFVKARAFVRSLGLKTVVEWRAWCRGDRPDLPPRPDDIPAGAAVYYSAEWQGFRDWLRGPERSGSQG
jgi:hypothetical protein